MSEEKLDDIPINISVIGNVSAIDRKIAYLQAQKKLCFKVTALQV